MIVKLLTEHHLEFLSLKGGSYVAAHMSVQQVKQCKQDEQNTNKTLEVQ